MSLKLSGSIITVTAILTSVLPVQAMPGYTVPKSINPDYQGAMGSIFNEDTQAFCNDVALGSNTRVNTGSSHTQSHSEKEKKGSGGIKVLGFGLNGGGGSTRTDSNSNQRQWDKTTNTTVTGRNCDTVVQGGVHTVTTLHTNETNLHMNADNNYTQRYGFDAQVEMQRNNNKLQRDLFNRGIVQQNMSNMFAPAGHPNWWGNNQ